MRFENEFQQTLDKFYKKMLNIHFCNIKNDHVDDDRDNNNYNERKNCLRIYTTQKVYFTGSVMDCNKRHRPTVTY